MHRRRARQLAGVGNAEQPGVAGDRERRRERLGRPVGLVVGEPEADHAPVRVLRGEVGLVDGVGRIDRPVGGHDDAHADAEVPGRRRPPRRARSRGSARAARCARCGAGGRSAGSTQTAPSTAASSTTSRTRRASASGVVSTWHAATYMPENAAKFPNPRIGGTSTPNSAASSRNVSRAHRALEMEVEMGLRERSQVAHQRDHGIRGRRTVTHRNAAFIMRALHRNHRPSRVRSNSR